MASNMRGRPKVFTEEYIRDVFNDYVLNNLDSLINPTKLSKWSEHPKWKERWADGEIKAIPRTVWYQEGWREKIEEYNSIPFILRAESIEKAVPFNIKKIVDKYYGNKKELVKALMGFQERANIALKIAVENESFRSQNETLKEENILLKEKINELENKVAFYKNECEELVFESHSIEKRTKKGIKENVLSSFEKSKEKLIQELSENGIREEISLTNTKRDEKYFLDDDLISYLKNHN
ncbi:hypothetical protein [Clostridium magnum]|uniref:Uncharacterized protein n=1 Tax=Clostridium magnum DSM 2767 TaxID=1121326 RepID=A0A162SPV7_9CLOT|nr:hypothetical protein [Clostridium magnum]KZL91713.1 hypothetical protein CLMAG_34720 [Clostridium magnum DSM 2767]SHJ39040.1 hypothetical protein SAMN02745944_05877 [Clostridium magnum DSM 2767]